MDLSQINNNSVSKNSIKIDTDCLGLNSLLKIFKFIRYLVATYIGTLWKIEDRVIR